MASRAPTARKTPVTTRPLVAGLLVLCAGTAGAQGPGSRDRVAGSAPPAAPDPAFLVAPRPATSGSLHLSPSGASLASQIPDPRALKGANARTAARLRLNVKGFSLLERGEGTGFRINRIREREWRRPAVSLTFQKRF